VTALGTLAKNLKIGVVGFFHETNTFAPGKTELESFRAEWTEGREPFFEKYEGTRTSMGGAIDAARAEGVELVPGLYTQATPGGTVADETFKSIATTLCDSVDPTVDGLLVILHGAMACETIHDPEGELLRLLRRKLGRELPFAITLDLHGNVSDEMVDLADIVVGYDTYPHVDVYERAVEAVRLLVRTIRKQIRPVRRLVRPGLLVAAQAMLTDAGPMKRLMDFAFRIETAPGIVNVSVFGGFPYADVPDAGMSFVVTADGDGALADRYARELAELAWSMRDEFEVRLVPPAEAVGQAARELSGPVVLAEGSDNVGGGAPADGTHLLPYLMKIDRKSLIVIRDPEAARAAAQIGVGGAFRGEIGGKSDDLHGKPVFVEGTVRTLFDGKYRHIGPYMTGQRADMGLTAVVETGPVTVILTERRVPPWDPGHVRSVGLDPRRFHIIVAKSAIAWKTAFGDVATRAIDVDTPGCCAANLHRFAYRNVRRPVYPLDPAASPSF